MLENIKENDLVTLGFGSIGEAEESIDIIEAYTENVQASGIDLKRLDK